MWGLCDGRVRASVSAQNFGEKNHTVLLAVDQAMAKRFERSTEVTEYREFPGRSRFIIGKRGWGEVASYALDWAEEHIGAAAPT
jgi:hypothetical protein